jgi:hypothetical protein
VVQLTGFWMIQDNKSTPQQQETSCGFRVFDMASMFATTNLTYQAGVQRLIGIKKIPEKCREHVVMDVMQQQKLKPPTWILLFWHHLWVTLAWITRGQFTT